MRNKTLSTSIDSNNITFLLICMLYIQFVTNMVGNSWYVFNSYTYTNRQLNSNM